VYIDAPQEIRAHRILSRARFGDPQTIEEFTIADERDQGINQQGFGQNTAKVVVLADKKIINDGDLISLSKQIGELVASLRQ
jgi:dephospho-CoA kinase